MLPREILYLIAEELFDNSARSANDHYGHEDRKNFRLVCKEFHGVVRTDRLFRTLSPKTDVAHIYDFEKHPAAHLVKVLRVSVGNLLNLLPETSNMILPRTLRRQGRMPYHATPGSELIEEPEQLQNGMPHSLQAGL